MLVISRKKKQSIIFDDGNQKIEVFVQDIYDYNGQQFVKLSLNAPKSFRITRSDFKDKSDQKPEPGTDDKK